MGADQSAQSSERRRALNWFFSEDDSLLYVTVSHGTHGFERRVMVMETDTLSVRRMIFGEAVAYNAHIDQLVLSYDGIITLVDASAMRDVAQVQIRSDLGIAAIPGSGDYIFAYSELAADDQRIPFIAVVDAEGEILSEQRASEFLGIDYDPEPGAPWFDSTGDYFALGTQGFRILDDGTFEDLGFTVPFGQLFQQRVDCNYHRVFDPVNRYEIWFDCDGWDNHPGAMAIISTDRGNIPISIRANSANTLLHPPSGRAFILDENLSISVVHYADPLAAQRPAATEIVTVDEGWEPGQACSAEQECPFEQICLGETDTAWTGSCAENVRTPFLRFCGGITGVDCDEGFSCELHNPTNPDSMGACVGCPNRDYEDHGPLCSPDGECLPGFACNDQGRCVPQACMNDEDCGEGEVCGMVRDVGRVCIAPGPLEVGDLCDGPHQCQSGVCMDPHLESGPAGFCATLCTKNADCTEDFECHHHITPWPICVHREWAQAGYRPHDDCEDCDTNAICTDRAGERCQIGFFPGPMSCEIGIDCESDQDCALPGSCIHLATVRDDHPLWEDEKVCGFPCSQTADCPWDADCINGTCAVTRAHYNDQGYFCEDQQGCPDDQWCLGLQFPSDPFHCVDIPPCYRSAECEDGLECYGFCSKPCDEGVHGSAAACDPGQQCVWDGESFFGPICMPPVCDCPDTQGPPATCRLDTFDCTFRQNCTEALCDGSFGPIDPDDPEGQTCCRPGNPCDLDQEDLCQCPPTCDFWTQSYCCHHGSDCPSPDHPATVCPEGYQCQLVDGGGYQTYGFYCATD